MPTRDDQIETSLVPYERAKQGAAGPRGKFDEARREVYLGVRRMGRTHMAALRAAGISPATYDRYRAAVGETWSREVRWAVEESKDPFFDKRRELALEGEQWALDREIGRGALAEEKRAEAAAGGSLTQIGAVVVGGGQGIEAGLSGLLERLAERKAAIESGDAG